MPPRCANCFKSTSPPAVALEIMGEPSYDQIEFERRERELIALQERHLEQLRVEREKQLQHVDEETRNRERMERELFERQQLHHQQHQQRDLCPLDPKKTSPGQCGCGVEEQAGDADGDGVIDCLDPCPLNPNRVDGDCPCESNKPFPMQCGCAVWDEDTDRDGTADCIDGCPFDRFKVTSGKCGCGIPDDDDDADGTPNCFDICPNDPLKTTPMTCGCGMPETDTDGDGTADCIDQCPHNALKTLPLICGCDAAEGTCWRGSGSVEFYLEALVVVLCILVFIMWRLNANRRAIAYQQQPPPMMRSPVPNSPIRTPPPPSTTPPPSSPSPYQRSGSSTLTQRKQQSQSHLTPVRYNSAELRLQQIALSANQSTLSEDSV